MVCVVCILPPILLAIYIKFIQPVILRLLPESWKMKFNALLYPTCPIPTSTQNVATASDKAPNVHSRDVQKRDEYPESNKQE
ncbi:unnamed protein product [Cercopithifilaria johnstoni]|uniref:Uncharacterized protein n=1 Tax=Cercopithifilaria johnstoni TaxID=2874296 RepID=A0A8J2MLE4_9BILA|nr:unnamed protein product [Cercopithifilaria johnstoni]